MTPAATIEIPTDVERWIDAGREDIELFAFKGLGVQLHKPQVEAAQAVLAREAQYYVLDWANRTGKTTLLCLIHLHQLWYKPWLDRDLTHREWLHTDYTTLHCAPLGELAGRAHLAVQEITRGTYPAQRDWTTNVRNPAPLATLYTAQKERDDTGADHMVWRCVTGGKTDLRSTEGKAARLESGAWRLISWDEWPATEGDPDDIRYIAYVRLANRAADFEAPILLTGTRTEDTEHIAKEFDARAEDPADPDWWGNHAARTENPSVSLVSLERAQRNMDPEDYARTVLGVEGGVKGRIFPPFLIDRAFSNDLPRFTPPSPGDGFPARQELVSKYTYLHLWDLAIAKAENIGMVWRVPASWRFSADDPIVGVSMKVIPGSRTLTSPEIIHTIEETFLPYGGLIVLDTTDAHGKSIHRELRAAGYPVEAFTFNERVGGRVKHLGADRSMLRKERAIKRARDLMTDGLGFERDRTGEVLIDADTVGKLDLSKPFGALRLPASWSKARDQLGLLKPDDQRQRKDAAMCVLMGGDVAIGRRRALGAGFARVQPYAFHGSE